MADKQDAGDAKQSSHNQVGKPIRSSLPLKYKLPFYGHVHRAWSKLIHRFGYHYAPKQYPPEPHESRTGLDGKPIIEWYHWCQWCGLRGTTIELPQQLNHRPKSHNERTQASFRPSEPTSKENKHE